MLVRTEAGVDLVPSRELNWQPPNPASFRRLPRSWILTFAPLHGEQVALARLAQHAVDVNGTQTESIGKNILVERTLE